MKLTALFPTAERVADASPRRLQSIGLTQARVATLRRFASAVSDGSITLNAGQALGDLTEDLQAIPGIGSWTAHYIAMRGCGHPDAFPAGDLGIRRALSSNGSAVSESVAWERSESWRPWRAYAAMTLWLASGGAFVTRRA